MPETLITPDEKMHTLFSHSALADLVAEYAGEDAARKVAAEQARNAYDEAKANTDLGAFEADLEHLHRQMRDWADDIGEMIEDLYAHQISKHEIAEAAIYLKKQIEKEL